MNNHKRPPMGNDGGARKALGAMSVGQGAGTVRRGPQPGQRPNEAVSQRKPSAKAPNEGWVHPDRRPGPGPQAGRPGYTQMTLRPMTSMPRDRIRGYENGYTDPRRSQEQRQNGPRQGAVRPQTARPNSASRAGQASRGGVGALADNAVRKTPPAGRPAANREQRGGADPRRAPKKGAPERRAPQKPGARPPRNDQWVIPEGSPVYTAQGRIYEGARGRRQHPDPRTAQRPPRRDGFGSGQKQPQKKKKAFNKEKLLHGVKIFFVRLAVMLVVFSLLGMWWYRAEFYSDSRSRSGTVSYSMKDVGSYEAKASLAYKDDVLYVDFTEISKWFGMVSVGSINTMRFICTDGMSETSSGKGGEEYTIFTQGSSSAVINGIIVDLEGACRTVDSHIWVPLSFVENYIGGIVCEKDASGDDITFSFEGDEDGDESEDKDEEVSIEEKYALIGFGVKRQTPIDRVEYPGRPE